MSNTVERALWTAFQALLASFTSFVVLTDLSTLKAAVIAGLISAGASLLSALKTLVQTKVQGTE